MIENTIMLSGLANINVELTSRCNKNCWICGRRRIEREYPHLAGDYGDMDFGLVERVARQLPPNVVVQLHNNGEPLLYPRFAEAVRLFEKQITSIDTNGKLLVEKADEIIGNVDTVAISVFEDDAEANEQYELIEKFLNLKGEHKPLTLLRINGDVDTKRYNRFGLRLARRILHAPMGSFNYRKGNPTIPEIGICLDFLHHLSIDRHGTASICVRFDPKRLGVIGNANTQSLVEIWNSPQRMQWLGYHKLGQRQKIPLCSYCHFWGVPTGNVGEDEVQCVGERDVFPAMDL